ncbi:MAG: hypothetical protein ACHQIO_04250 [Nevskiales bacterium]
MSSSSAPQSVTTRPTLPAAITTVPIHEPVQRTSVCQRFIGGEWLIDEAWRDYTRGRPESRHRLYYQPTVTAPCEAMGEIAADDVPAAMVRPQLSRSGERCVIVFGRHVFQRWPTRQGPYWYRVTTQPFGAAPFFLRDYLRRRHADATGNPGLNPPDVPYVFGHVDIERNVLVTSREHADPRFPQFLVYSAPGYSQPWQFDIERTRRANGIR